MRKFLIFVFCLMTISTVIAEVPHVITYQGRLTNLEGAPLEGDFTLIFAIYDAPEGGNELWTSGPQPIGIAGGLFTYDLGMSSPIPDSVFLQHFERWLGITINEEPELLPRTAINSVAFAYRAQFADGAGFTEMSNHAAEAEHAIYADTAGYAFAAPGGGFTLPYSGAVTHPGPAFYAQNAGPGSGPAIRGDGELDDGVVGYTETLGKSGIYGYSPNGNGVSGRAEGDGHGVFGETSSIDTLYAGVRGSNFGAGAGVAGFGLEEGVRGWGYGSAGIGVHGVSTGDGYGGYFEATGPGGVGIYANGQGNNAAAILDGDLIMYRGQVRGGVPMGSSTFFRSDTLTSDDSGVVFATYDGPSTYGGALTAISGISVAEDSTGRGGYFRGGWIGTTTEVYPYGNRDFYGLISNVWAGGNPSATARNTAIYARSYGNDNPVNWGLQVFARDGIVNYGIDADVTNELPPYSNSNYGFNTRVTGGSCNYGVYSEAGSGLPDSLNCAVYGAGYHGRTTMGGNFYVLGDSLKYGIYAEAEGPGRNYAIYGVAPVTPTSYTGFFEGDVGITGTLYGGKNAVRIDHPLDPENQYLIHSAVESSELKNVYDGVVMLDNNGQAMVSLPDYFEALNQEFRYQLTCVGGYAPVFIAGEIADNRFTIAGGSPGLKVCWQVTGVRRDAAAMARPLEVEMDKPVSEQGTYLNPEAFGLSEEYGLSYNQRRGMNDERERSRLQHKQNNEAEPEASLR